MGVNMVTWGCNEHVKTQVSITKGAGDDRYKLRFGLEVGEALRAGEIDADSVIQHFSPSVFISDLSRSQRALARLSNLPPQAVVDILRPRLVGADGRMSNVNSITDSGLFILVVLTLSCQSLQQLAQSEEGRSLGIPTRKSDDLFQYIQWIAPQGSTIRLAISLSAVPTYLQVRCVRAWAEAVGLPVPEIFSGPACLLGCRLRQGKTELWERQKILVCEVGAGFAILQASEVTLQKP